MALAAGFAATAADAKHAPNFTIHEQSLQNALVSLAVQANISISTPSQGLSALRSAELSGQLSVEAALDLLLSKSGYTFRRIDDATYQIVPRSDQPEQPIIQSGRPDIVVTAAFQPQSIDRMPQAVTSIGADQIRSNGLRGASDLVVDAASLRVTNLGPGRNKLFIRGLSDGAFTGRTQSTVGIYLGESRLTYGAPDPDLLLIDIDNVEILRGPQGVQYGAGSIGGIYRIAPKAPEFNAWGGQLSATGVSNSAGGEGGSLEGVFNAPLVKDRAAARFVAYREEAPGWLDNPGLGLGNTNRTVRQGGRAQLAVRLGESWTLGLSGVAQTITSKDSQYLRIRRDVRTNAILEPHDNEFAALAFTLRGATPWGELTSTSTWVRHDISSLYDASGAFDQLGAPVFVPASFEQRNELDFYTEELRLRGAASPFAWAIGAFASSGQSISEDDVVRMTAPRSLGYQRMRRDDITELAVFGEATTSVTDAVNITVGARWFLVEQKANIDVETALVGGEASFRGRQSQSDVAPRVAVSYQPNARSLYYLQAAQGFRAGGFNSISESSIDQSVGMQPFQTYSGDKLWSLEAGAKKRFLHDRLNLRAALYEQYWINVESDQLVVGGLPFTGNVGDATVRGIEIEAGMRWMKALLTNASINVVDAEITRVNASFPVSADAGLPGAPRVSAALDISYAQRIAQNLELSLSLRGEYVGRSNVTFEDARTTDTGGYSEFKVRAEVRGPDWSLAAFANNVLDDDGSTFSYGNPSQFGARRLKTPLTPQTIGLSLSKSFGGAD